MYRHSNHSKIFGSGRIDEKFRETFQRITQTIESESEDYILNVNQTEYVEHLVNSHKMDIPIIHYDDVYADSYEDDIPLEYFSRGFDRFGVDKVKKEIIQFFIPVSGNVNLLNYCPVTTFYIGGGGDFKVNNDTISAEFINFNNDGPAIKMKFGSESRGIRSNYDSLIKDIENFNDTLKSNINSVFSKRKNKLLNKNSLMSSLGVPLKRKQSTTNTFSVPKPKLKEKIKVVKPIVTEKGFKPEPALDEDSYRHILKLINDVGKNFERMPSVYKGKGEEDLRDYILMTLDPNFELGSASGETFNKSGKTDIQLRYDSSVIFIAECKFWSGEKGYLKTISQLLNYLTWRDTKASVIMFVRQQDFSSILEKVNTSTETHDNYLSFVNKTDENWFNFRFHINGDKNRELKLAVQLYHLPK